MDTQPQILRIGAVTERTGLARSTVYKWISRGQFPRPVKLGARAVGWHRSDIEAWIAGRPAA